MAHCIADRLGIPLEEALDRLSSPELAEWQAYLALLHDEDAFQSPDDRYRNLLRRVSGDR